MSFVVVSKWQALVRVVFRNPLTDESMSFTEAESRGLSGLQYSDTYVLVLSGVLRGINKK
jgi:hypothetical protein